MNLGRQTFLGEERKAPSDRTPVRGSRPDTELRDRLTLN